MEQKPFRISTFLSSVGGFTISLVTPATGI